MRCTIAGFFGSLGSRPLLRKLMVTNTSFFAIRTNSLTLCSAKCVGTCSKTSLEKTTSNSLSSKRLKSFKTPVSTTPFFANSLHDVFVTSDISIPLTIFPALLNALIVPHVPAPPSNHVRDSGYASKTVLRKPFKRG